MNFNEMDINAFVAYLKDMVPNGTKFNYQDTDEMIICLSLKDTTEVTIYIESPIKTTHNNTI